MPSCVSAWPKADRPDPRDRPDDFLHYVGKEDIAFSQEFGIGVPALCGIWMNATQAGGDFWEVVQRHAIA